MVLTIATLLGNVNDPRREQAPSRWRKGSVKSSFESIVSVIREVHPNRDDKCDEEGQEPERPPSLDLHRCRLVTFVSSQRVPEEHSNRVDRESVRRNDVHPIGDLGYLRQANAEENVNRELVRHGDVESRDCGQNGESNDRLNSSSRPFPHRNGEEGRRNEKLHVDAGVVRVGQADRVVAKPILDEQQVSPPVLSADVRVRGDNQIPHRARPEKRQNVSAEEYQKDDRWDDAKIPVKKFTPDYDVATPHEPTDERVSRQKTAEHEKDVGVERSRRRIDEQEWIRHLSGHLGPIDEGVEQYCHRLVAVELKRDQLSHTIYRPFSCRTRLT
jgi:hypothetical protein